MIVSIRDKLRNFTEMVNDASVKISGLKLINSSEYSVMTMVDCVLVKSHLDLYITQKKLRCCIFQVLQHCHAVLQEIPSGLRQKRPTSIADSLHHMTACITFHMAKVRCS